MIPVIVFILCVLTCFGCAFFLGKAFRASKLRLLFWSSLCFFILGCANLLLFADLVIYPGVNLMILRNAVTLAAVFVLLLGLIFESR